MREGDPIYPSLRGAPNPAMSKAVPPKQSRCDQRRSTHSRGCDPEGSLWSALFGSSPLPLERIACFHGIASAVRFSIPRGWGRLATTIQLALVVCAVGGAAPLASKQQAKRDSYLNAVSACARAIDTRTASLNAKAGQQGPAAASEASELKRLRRWLEPLPATREQFRLRFFDATRDDILVQSLLLALRRQATPLVFYDQHNPGQCQGSQIAYFTPGPSHREVGMCLHHGDLMGRSIVGFIHETLHLYQFTKGPVRDLLTFPFNDEKKVSERAVAYTPDAKYIDSDNEFSTKGQAIVLGLPTALRARVSQVLWALDGVKTLFLMYPKEEAIEFVPKKPWVVPDEKFYQALEARLGGDRGFEDETADLRFHLGLLSEEHKDPSSVNRDQEILRLSEGWYDWLQEHPEYRRRSRKEQLSAYVGQLGEQYASLMREVEKNFPQHKGEVSALFGMFFASSRILRGLLNFCAEMQANMQSKILLYLFYRHIEGIPGCSGSSRRIGKMAIPSLFR